MKEYFHIKTKKGDIIVKDGTRDDLRGLVSIYKKSFKKHNIFQKSAFRVEEYLLDKHRRNHKFGGGFIVAKKDRNTIGGILLTWKESDIKGKHSRWKFNHLVVDKLFSRLGIGKKLLDAATDKIKNLIKEKRFRTAKIEINVAQKQSLEFYKKSGFGLEGKLKNHYRLNETSHVLGKVIK